MSLADRLFNRSKASDTLFGGGAIVAHTLTTTQGYTVNWDALENRYPEIQGMDSYKDKWQHLEKTRFEDPDEKAFIFCQRTKMPGSYHEVRDKVVTSAFVADIVDVLQNTTADWNSVINYKHHACGTSTAAEAAGDTAMGAAHGTRDAGTQTEGTVANIYVSVATHTYTATVAVTEHGMFNKTSSGTLMDRTLFAVINVVSGNQIEFTFSITFSSGG